jgi:hypothetical protein
LSALYRTDIEVLKVQGRYVVVGEPGAEHLTTDKHV